MNRRTFLKTVAILPVAVLMPMDVPTAAYDLPGIDSLAQYIDDVHMFWFEHYQRTMVKADAVVAALAQEQYWQLSGRIAWLEYADDVTDGELIELTLLKAEMQRFCKDHDGESFRVFRPEHVFAALSASVEPWGLLG